MTDNNIMETARDCLLQVIVVAVSTMQRNDISAVALGRLEQCNGK